VEQDYFLLSKLPVMNQQDPGTTRQQVNPSWTELCAYIAQLVRQTAGRLWYYQVSVWIKTDLHFSL